MYENIAKGKWSDESEDVGIEFTVIEAPYVYYNKATKYYYLFVNWGGCCEGLDSTYNIRVGRSRNVTGPFKDKKGRNMMDAKGSMVLKTKPKNTRIVGPGHAGIFHGGISGQE